MWVGDPNGYTPMDGIPEFRAEMGRNGKVQGADYPARIWGAYMEAAHVNLPVVDWPATAAGRHASRRASTSRARSAWPSWSAARCRRRPARPPPPRRCRPSRCRPDPDATAHHVAKAVVVQVTSGTLVPDNVLDPRAPMPSVDLKTLRVPLRQAAGRSRGTEEEHMNAAALLALQEIDSALTAIANRRPRLPELAAHRAAAAALAEHRARMAEAQSRIDAAQACHRGRRARRQRSHHQAHPAGGTAEDHHRSS